MKPSIATQAIKSAIAGHLPLFLWGPPGVGKSALVKQAADSLFGSEVHYLNGAAERERYLRDVRVLLLDPVDLRGLPNLGDDGRAHWAPAEFLPEDGEGVLFLDELNAAPGAVQAACFTPESWVSGVNKPICELAVGDSVIDHTGSSQLVTDVFERHYEGNIYRIKARHFLNIAATEEHPFFVIERFQRENEGWGKKRIVSDPIWKRSDQLSVGDYVGIPVLQSSRSDSHIIIEKNGDVETSVKLTSSLARYLGYYVGDGYSSNGRIGIAFNREETDYHADVMEIITEVFGRPPSIRPYSSTGNSHDIGFGDARLAAWLKEQCGENTYCKKIPDCILYHEDKELLRQFLIGYYRADGHIYNNGNPGSFVGLTTVSKALAMQLQQAFTRFDLLVAVHEREGGSTEIRGKIHNQRDYYRVQSSQIEAFELLGIKRLDPVARKTRHFFSAHGCLWARIDSISPEPYSGTVYNCEVDTTHTYMVHNIIVHNCYQLVLDRALGEYRLPDGWAVVAAGNRAEDRAVVNRMSTALASRMIHVDVETDLDDWTVWAARAGVDPRVIAFCRFKPDVLMAFEPSANDRTFPCPRTWEYVSRLLATSPPADVLAPMLAGTVGEGAAAEFGAFLKVAGKVPSFDKIIAAPNKAPVPDGMDALHVISAAIGARASAQNLDAVCEYADRMPVEFAMAGLRMAANRNPEVCDCHAWQVWSAKNADALI